MAKRGQGEGTISKRPDGTWWARISVGYDAQGKRKRKAFYGKTRKEVQEKLTAALNEVNTGTYIEPSKMTVSEWMDTWLREYNKNVVKPGTFYRTYKVVQKHIIPKLGKYKLKELRKDMVQKFVNDLVADGYKPGTVVLIFGKLRCALSQAYESELISKNPALYIKLPVIEKEEKKVLTPEQQKEFIKKATERDDVYGSFFILLLATGLRISEALALTWGDIDFKQNLLYVNKTKALIKDVYNRNSVTFGYTSPKTRTSNRAIPLLPSIASILKSLQREQGESKHVLNDKYINVFEKNNLVFCTYKGTSLEAARVGRQLKILLRESGIPEEMKITPHSLRHTFATRGMEKGVDMKVMQQFLGHAKINMTADLYTHVLDEMKNESMMKLQNTINL